MPQKHFWSWLCNGAFLGKLSKNDMGALDDKEYSCSLISLLAPSSPWSYFCCPLAEWCFRAIALLSYFSCVVPPVSTTTYHRRERMSSTFSKITFGFFRRAFSLTTAHHFLRFGRRWLTISLKYGILTAEEKTRHGVNLLVTWRYEFCIYRIGISVGEFALTTPLTIYRLGLCGNSANESIGKHRFRTKKHRKVAKIT